MVFRYNKPEEDDNWDIVGDHNGYPIYQRRDTMTPATQEWLKEQFYAERSAKDKQIGGDHYDHAIQPIEFILANELGFIEGNVLKYIIRHREKNGKQDLEKAIHYLELLIEHEYPEED